STDAAVLAALDGPRIYDHVPRKVIYPYVTFGHTTARDRGTGDGDGEEHIISLHIWSLAAGRAEANGIAAAIRVALHDRDLSVSGHRLINLRYEFPKPAVSRTVSGSTGSFGCALSPSHWV